MTRILGFLTKFCAVSRGTGEYLWLLSELFCVYLCYLTGVLLGEGLVLCSTISLAVSGILVKKYSKDFNVVMLSGYQFILGGFVMIVVGLALGGRINLVPQFSAYLLLLYMALISAVAYSIWGILMKYNPVSRVSIFNFLTPLFGVLLSAIFLGEVEQALSWNKLAALILVSGGIYIVNRKYEKA